MTPLSFTIDAGGIAGPSALACPVAGSTARGIDGRTLRRLGVGMSKPQYRHAHQQTRTAWAAVVNSGEAHCTEPICLMPSRWIPPGSQWHLAHNRAGGGYHGPAHVKCNTSEGARWLAQLKATKPEPTANRWRL